MADLVKWWRHKILGGYKQFSVLQDSATDSEEIIYPIRAPSSCSAPPDLLLTTSQDRLTANDVLMVTHNRQNLTSPNSHNQSPLSQSNVLTQKRLQQHRKMLLESQKQQQQQLQQQTKSKDMTSAKLVAAVETDEPDHVRLEEFHCDVNLEQKLLQQQQQLSKTKPQPVQFSFTLYDLDGHGKITKDDIAGIVSTIYESLGKSVVVPHYGSKTINVRLTVSPDSGQTGKNQVMEKPPKKVVTPRRRYRPRKLISDDEGSDTSHDLTHKNCLASPKQKLKSKHHSSPLKSPLKEFSVQAPVATVAPILTTPTVTETNLINLKTPTPSICHSQKDGLYDSVKTTPEVQESNLICGECSNKKMYENVDSITSKHQQLLQQQREYRKKLLRKSRSRKQKYNEMPVSRVRSLSVGNENSWKTRADRTEILIDSEERVQIEEGKGFDVVGNKSDEECWRSSLRRKELIEIIRESMEKNRLCFQNNNRKPLDSSPMMRNHQHRHRSHTINSSAKVMDDTVENRLSAPAATTPTNLCGYDSYLHATICTGNSSGVVVTPQMGVATPIRKKCNQKLIKSRLRQQQQFMAQQQQIMHQQQISEQHQQKKSAHNSELRKLRKAQRLVRSKSKEELVSKEEKMCVVGNLLTTDNFMDKLKITEEVAEKFVETSKGDDKKICSKRIASRKQNELILEYASIPVTAEPGECENLLKSSNATTPNDELDLDAELTKKSSPTHSNSTQKSQNSVSTVHRYVHEHIHHHYHHFENEDIV